MSFSVRDGNFDVVIAAGPGLSHWPSVGVRALSTLCAEVGLSVGVLGGDHLRVRGVIPHSGTGGLVLVEDHQKRIHRIVARALVKVSSHLPIPPVFEGWFSQGVIPYSTAMQLLNSNSAHWEPATVILGSGNRAFRLGSTLLELGLSEIICLESNPDWGAKRYSGWEVERRRFEMAGGKIIEGKPISLSHQSPLLWEFRVQDPRGVRVIEVAKIIAVGPFAESLGWREFPPGSLLFELEQTSLVKQGEDFEGWVLEEERARWLAAKMIRALVDSLGDKREEIQNIYRKSKARIKRYLDHREHPFSPVFQGKWTSAADFQLVRKFSGVPESAQKMRKTASIECFENIPCNLCEVSCPESAIQFSLSRDAVLNESKCTACGICLQTCPSQSILMLKENENISTSEITLPWKGAYSWKAGEFAVLVNRKGDELGSGRVLSYDQQLVQLDVPTHLVWEARGIRRKKREKILEDLDKIHSPIFSEEKVEIILNGEKRLVRDQISVSKALYETGQSRASDMLLCPDGSCGLCSVLVDGIKKLACQTPIHAGMSVRFVKDGVQNESALCPCLGITQEEVLKRVEQGKFHSLEAVLSATHLGEGRCHGQFCLESLRRILIEKGFDASSWIDWRFPWSDWLLTPGTHGSSP